jgi:hypothetical protein
MAIPRHLPPAWRGTLRRLYKAVVPQPFFDLSATMKWLDALKEGGVAFGFPEDMADGGPRSLAILKHDIHDNLDRAVAMARAESALGIHGLYFMMGPHELNRTFYGTAHAWEQLRAIQDMGHRIGLHLDPFDALRSGGLYEFIARTIAEFSRERITVRYGNSHGDSKYESLSIRQQDLFVESLAPLSVAGRNDANMALHAGKYSLEHLASAFGIEYWVDSRVFRQGVRLQRTVYVSDNAGQIRIRPQGPSSRRFEIDGAFVAESVPFLTNSRALILLHPQWYASRNGR